MLVLKHWVFIEDIWNFNKWKSLIVDENCWMLWKAMPKETIIVLSKKVISTENVEGKSSIKKKK